jgi:restriction system protein
MKPNIYCIRAESGEYTDHFLKGHYAAIGWLSNHDLSKIKSDDELYALHKQSYPDETSAHKIGSSVGQIALFLLEIKADDYVVTPAADLQMVHVGIVEPDPSYFHSDCEDGCELSHRRRVKWLPRTFNRDLFSGFRPPTVFSLRAKDDFFNMIGQSRPTSPVQVSTYDPYPAVLDALLNLSPTEFEVLITDLLQAIGFQATHTGRPGDGGVDATGELNLANLASVTLHVQVKRYAIGRTISANDVKELRQVVSVANRGAFITTADFDDKAQSIAQEPGFPPIALVNGHQLVDLLVKHWTDIPEDSKSKLQLKQGLVKA